MWAWGIWDDEIDPVLLASLQLAYVRRKRWEAKLQASETVRALARAFGGDGSPQTSPGHSRVSPEVLMAKMGAKWH